jgi:hypothetical protein
MNGHWTGIIGILTTLLLLGAVGMAVLDLASFASAEEPATSALLNRTMFLGAMIFALAIVAPLIGALSLFVLLKRYGGPLIQIEYGAAAATVVGPFAARELGIGETELESLAEAVERKRRLESLTASNDDAPAAVPFDFGPTFADELSAQQSQASRQAEAVLAQLFADNLSLHEKIELDSDAEKVQEAATEMDQESYSQLAF